MDQSIIDRAVKIATRMAMNGHPAARIIWIPPQSASDNAGGSFAIEVCDMRDLTDSTTPPWEK